MKKIKLADAWTSTLLIVSLTIITLIKKDIEFLFLSYFIVGGWQVISMIAHALAGWFTHRPGARYAYHWISFTCVITMPIGSVYLLIFMAPVMAIYYTYLCFNEIYYKMKRPLSTIK